MNQIAVVRSVFLPIRDMDTYGELTHMKTYKAHIFCKKQHNISAFPYQNVTVSPRYNKLENMLRTQSFQLVHAQFATSGIRMAALKQKWNVPLVTSFHDYDSPHSATLKKQKRSLRHLFALGDCFTVPCQSMADQWIKYGCPKEKMVVQYSGIDLSRFRYQKREMPEQGPVNILFAGKLAERDGADILVRAFQRVHRAFPRARLILIGDGKLKQRLVQFSQAQGLETRIEFAGALTHEEAAAHFNKAHLFCLPVRIGRSEAGIPHSLKEAMACGLPVLSTRHAGIPELIEDGVTGHLVAKTDVDAVANKLIALIRRPDTWKTIGEQARCKIETDFNLDVQTERLERLYERVIATHHKQNEQQNEQRNEQQPFFSVIIPTYNRQHYVRRAIRSVLRQSCQDYELIVVDDGSKDRTKKVVQSFGSRVRYVYQKRQGPSKARNTGIQLATGKYIAFLDSDDQFLPHKLQRNKTFLEANPHASFLYSSYYEHKQGRKRLLLRRMKRYSDLEKFRRHLFKRKFTIRTSTAVIRKSCFDKVGGFHTAYRYSQDWDMWLRLASHYKGECLKSPLVLYRRHRRKRIPGSKRHKEIRKNANQLYQWKGERRHEAGTPHHSAP